MAARFCLEVPRVRAEPDLLDDVQVVVAGRGAEVVRVQVARGALLPEEADLGVAVLEAPVGAHPALGGDVAVGDGEAVLAVEPGRPGPAQARHPGGVDQVAHVDRVVGDERADDHHAAVLDQLGVAVPHLAVVLPRQPAGVHGDDLHRPVVDALVEGVLHGQDDRVHQVGGELAEVHVDQDADLHRLERIALGGDPAGRRVDDDRLDRPLPDPAAALVPQLVRQAPPTGRCRCPTARWTRRDRRRAIPWSAGAGKRRSAYFVPGEIGSSAGTSAATWWSLLAGLG